MQVKIVVKKKNVLRNPIGNKNLRFITKDGRISNICAQHFQCSTSILCRRGNSQKVSVVVLRRYQTYVTEYLIAFVFFYAEITVFFRGGPCDYW